MSADASPRATGDPLAPLAALPGVEAAVNAARTAVDRAYRHRVMRRRAPEVAAEAALRGARASAALSGADWALEEVRRRSDFGGDAGARTVGAALRLTGEAGPSLEVWRSSPLQVLARLHLLAAGGEAATAPDGVGRPRLDGEDVGEPELDALGPPPNAREVAARLDALARLVVTSSRAPALVTAGLVHAELATLRPFRSHNGLVARAAERLTLISGGLDPKAVAPAEVGHAEAGAEAYLAGLAEYATGTPEGITAWIARCGQAVELGARESVAVCEALQRGVA
ncbi:Fic family protein [Streptomyces sp. 7-21]|uniref:Fic family protein n=1 Tax=Streptomyces sp. 7-21 TaxID=2802283 RepID=UPI00191EF578|nr:Fic family protein [Streptomyces sp. 7-21]MBL1067836.1 Fic family protein [Streptomyces sp. 7-21]